MYFILLCKYICVCIFVFTIVIFSNKLFFASSFVCWYFDKTKVYRFDEYIIDELIIDEMINHLSFSLYVPFCRLPFSLFPFFVFSKIIPFDITKMTDSQIKNIMKNEESLETLK